MPKHPDFQKIYRNYVKQYGAEKGKKFYYAWVNKHGYDDTKPFPGKKKEGAETILENVPFKFCVPFSLSESSKTANNARTLHGTLLVPTTSRNNVTYEAEEIDKATFNGHPYSEETLLTMSLNHTDDVTDNMGLWKPIRQEGRIDFEAKAMNTGKHPYVIEMIDKGLIRYVSVEALAKQLISNGESVRAVGLDITGMGAVKTPGIIEAHAAIAEAFDKFKEEDDLEEIDGEDMEEQKEIETPKVVESPIDKLVEKMEQTILAKAEEKSKIEELTKEIEQLKEKIKEKESKGQVTVETVKPRFEMVVEKNRERPGTKDFYAKDVTY